MTLLAFISSSELGFFLLLLSLPTCQPHSAVHLRNELYKAFPFEELKITEAVSDRSDTMSLKVDFIVMVFQK